MCSLGLLDQGRRQQSLDGLLALSRAPKEAAVQHMFNDLTLAMFHEDPRLAPTKGAAMCQHAKWVIPAGMTNLPPVPPPLGLFVGINQR
jgi:hypothetical protein